MTNRYAQVMNLLSPRKSASFARIASIASSAAWCATSVSSGPVTGGWPTACAPRPARSAPAGRADHARLAAAPRQLRLKGDGASPQTPRRAPAPLVRQVPRMPRYPHPAGGPGGSHMTVSRQPADADRPLRRADGVLYRVTCLTVPPSAVQADELLSHARREVIGRDLSGQRDDSAHLGEVFGAVGAVREVRLEPAALRL